MSRRDPGAATGQAAVPTPPVDWSRWRKCPVCNAGIGQSCVEYLGRYVLEGEILDVQHEIDVPHSSREPRTGGTK